MIRLWLFITRIVGSAKTALQGCPILRVCLPVILLLFCGWSSPSAGQAQSKSSVIVFGAREDAAPFSSSSDGITFVGYTIDLCDHIFERYREEQGNENLELKYIPVTAEGRFVALAQGRIQALCGATTITVRRMRRYHFSLMIYLSGASVMKRRDNQTATLGNTKDQNIKVSVVGDTTTAAHVRHLLGVSVSTELNPNHAEAFEALQQAQVDFYFGDRAILRERLRRAENRDDFILAPGFLSYEPYAVAIHLGNHDLLYAANAALADLYRTGHIDRIFSRWFVDMNKSGLLNAMFELQKIPEGRKP